MGCNQAKPIEPINSDALEAQVPVEWKIMPSGVEARKKFEADGTLAKNSDPGQLELRTLLDDPLAHPVIFKYVTEVAKAQDLFLCWMDILEFKKIPSEGFRRTTAMGIYNKVRSHCLNFATVPILIDLSLRICSTSNRTPISSLVILTWQSANGISRSLMHRKKILTSSPPSKTVDVFCCCFLTDCCCNERFFDKVMAKCFSGLYYNVYLPFKQTQEYFTLTKNLQERYNYVRLNDFEYFSKLGEVRECSHIAAPSPC